MLPVFVIRSLDSWVQESTLFVPTVHGRQWTQVTSIGALVGRVRQFILIRLAVGVLDPSSA